MKLKPTPASSLIFFLLASGAAWAWPIRAVAKELPDHARELKAQLVQQVMPYWFDTAQDPQYGGYLLADDLKGRGTATQKQIVTQSRMVWGFSHAHLHGLGDGKRNYLKAAEQG